MSQGREEEAMSQGRGLLTEREREAIAGEASDSYRYKTRSFLRDRLEELEKDVVVLAEHDAELLEEVREVVCGRQLDENREYLEQKVSELEEKFPGCRPDMGEVSGSKKGLWISIHAGEDYSKLDQLVDEIGNYLSRRDFNVRAVYDKKGSQGDKTETRYQGHIYALPSELGVPDYPDDKFPPLRSEGDLETFEWG